MQLSELFAKIKAELPGWTWLIRSDREQGFFANLVSPNFKQYISFEGGQPEHKDVGMTFPHYADTPEAALEAAYEAAIIVGGKPHNPSAQLAKGII